MHQVICFGEVLWDNFPTGKKVGGAPLNVALHLFKQGLDSRLISAIGNDTNGTELKSFLAGFNFDTGLLQVSNKLATGIVEVELNEDNHATYTIVKPVAWDEIEYQPILSKITGKSDALIFGSLACRSEVSRRTLFSILPLAKLKVLDLNLRPPHFEKEIITDLIAQCDVLKINEHELEYLKQLYSLSGDDRGSLLSQLSILTGTNTICVTLGEQGAIVMQDKQFYSHPAFKIKVEDTVGAGDAFLATFIAGLLQHSPMDETLSRASAAGAIVASKSGATPDYTLEDILKIAEQPLTNFTSS